MIKNLTIRLNLILTALLLMVCVNRVFADQAVADLKGEDKERFDKFRHIFTTGNATEFYSYTKDYAAYLKKRGDMNLYYKLKSNESFFALRHNQILQAMDYAQQLEKEVRENKAEDYYYLPLGVMADIYYESHDMHKAEAFFLRALDEVGDRDPKFTMRVYQSLGVMLALKNPEQALTWFEKSESKAQELDNMEYLSMAVAMKGYVYFLADDAARFYQVYDEYDDLRTSGDPEFSKRYNNMMEIAKLTFDKDYQGARNILRRGNLYVDSALVAIRLLASEGNISDGFAAIRHRYVELDSIFCLAQEASFDHIATERTLMQAREEAETGKQRVKRLTNWLIGLTVAFLIIYLMGRRRLWLKIQTKNRDLKDALAHAEESDRMKTAFISNMSHEIRTPLNAVAGFSQVLCTPGIELADEEKADMQERITTNVELITTIVNEVLELSKSESESRLRPDSDMEEVRINQLCRSILRSMAIKANKGVETRFSTNVADDFTIRTHSKTVRRILTHILDNAQKFTEQGHVELRCVCDTDKKVLNLMVTDTGVGIPESDRDRIFELFEKADGNFKEGIGLGLPISQRLASSIGAQISLDPNYTDGSRFILSMPLL